MAKLNWSNLRMFGGGTSVFSENNTMVNVLKFEHLTPAVIFLELFSRHNFLMGHLSKTLLDEKHSGTSPPTSPNCSKFHDAAGYSVLRCSL